MMFEEIDGFVQEFNVKCEEVIEMEMCLLGGDIVFEGQVEDGEELYVLIVYLVDLYNELIVVFVVCQCDMLQMDGIVQVFDVFDVCSCCIIEVCWLYVDDDGLGGLMLYDFVVEFGVLVECICQIEVSVMKKMCMVFVEYV